MSLDLCYWHSGVTQILLLMWKSLSYSSAEILWENATDYFPICYSSFTNALYYNWCCKIIFLAVSMDILSYKIF